MPALSACLNSPKKTCLQRYAVGDPQSVSNCEELLVWDMVSASMPNCLFNVLLYPNRELLCQKQER